MQQDEKLLRVKHLIRIGWPEHAWDIHSLVRDFHAFKSELSETSYQSLLEEKLLNKFMKDTWAWPNIGRENRHPYSGQD